MNWKETRITQHSLLFTGLFPALFSWNMPARAQSLPDQTKERRPNILWISTEDLSPHLGCYGDQVAQTPNLDKLAAQGNAFYACLYDAPSALPVGANHHGHVSDLYRCHQHATTSYRRTKKIPLRIHGCSATYVKPFTEYCAHAYYWHQQQQNRLPFAKDRS